MAESGQPLEGQPGRANNASPAGGSAGLGPAPTVVAIVVLVAFGLLLVYMMGKVHTDQQTWDRRVYLYGSVEAIVFAAAGGLFGREVNRQRAEDARTDAAKAQEKATTAEADAREQARGAIAGRALA